MRPLAPIPREQLLALSEYARRRASSRGGDLGPDLAAYELKVFSQNGEDGVLGEILRRIGTRRHGYFVEFGGEDGVELNCALLADVYGWHGLLLEADPAKHHHLHHKYLPREGVTTGIHEVHPHNVEELFEQLGVPERFDVLSIDIDGDDYWVWRAIERFAADVVVIEFNANLDPSVPLVQPQGAGPWDGTAYYGASLAALRELGERKGYRLVHVELTGNNAFFVRQGLRGKFPDEIRLLGANHFLLGRGHPPDEQGREFVTPPAN